MNSEIAIYKLNLSSLSQILPKSRNVNVVTTKTNLHLNGFVILSRNLSILAKVN